MPIVGLLILAGFLDIFYRRSSGYIIFQAFWIYFISDRRGSFFSNLGSLQIRRYEARYECLIISRLPMIVGFRLFSAFMKAGMFYRRSLGFLVLLGVGRRPCRAERLCYVVRVRKSRGGQRTS